LLEELGETFCHTFTRTAISNRACTGPSHPLKLQAI
jgi:hypothetical protein